MKELEQLELDLVDLFSSPLIWPRQNIPLIGRLNFLYGELQVSLLIQWWHTQYKSWGIQNFLRSKNFPHQIFLKIILILCFVERCLSNIRNDELRSNRTLYCDERLISITTNFEWCSIKAIAAGVDCEHSPLLTTLHFACTAKLNIVVRPPVLNRKRDIPKFCDVASGRTDCRGTYPQRDDKSNNHLTSIYTINRMGRVCPGNFPSTLKSSIPDWVRTSSREKLLSLL